MLAPQAPKRVGVQVDRYDPIIADACMRFSTQAWWQASARSQPTGMSADPSLYAGGISVMGQDDFLNPHIDNSHDGDQKLYRVVNLLYYVSPDWKEEYGGHLELWDERCGSRSASPAGSIAWRSWKRIGPAGTASAGLDRPGPPVRFQLFLFANAAGWRRVSPRHHLHGPAGRAAQAPGPGSDGWHRADTVVDLPQPAQAEPPSHATGPLKWPTQGEIPSRKG